MPEEADNQLDYYRGSLYGALCNTVREHPGLGALNFLGRRYRYDFLLNRVDSFAAALKGVGVGKGDIVSIMLPNCPQAVIAFYATNKIGAIANMMHPLMSSGELERDLALVGTKLLLTMDIFYDKATQAIEGWRANGGAGCMVVVTKIVDELPIYARAVFKARARLKELPVQRVRRQQDTYRYRNFIGHGHLLLQRDPDTHGHEEHVGLADEPAAILFSGGTTGTPKGILLSNDNINSGAEQVHTNTSFPMAPGDRILLALPLFHGFGLVVCLHVGICQAMEGLLVPRLTPKEYTRVILRGRCSYVVGVPTLLCRIADLPGGKNLDLSFIKEVVSGGDSLPPEMRDRINERLDAAGCKVHVREGYGATECTSSSAIQTVGDPCEGTFGRPLLGNRMKIVDTETGLEVATGQDGELLIAGPTIMMGYWNNPEETAKVIEVDEQGTRWLHTGDIARKDEEGHLFYRGRIKRMIISSGYNIYPDQIEHELNELPQVESSCVIGVPDGYRLHRIKAFVTLADGYETTDGTRAAILEALKTRVARYSWPKELEFRDELPLTKMGKVDYRALEAEEAELRESRA